MLPKLRVSKNIINGDILPVSIPILQCLIYIGFRLSLCTADASWADVSCLGDTEGIILTVMDPSSRKDTCSHSHFVYHKSQTEYPGIEP